MRRDTIERDTRVCVAGEGGGDHTFGGTTTFFFFARTLCSSPTISNVRRFWYAGHTAHTSHTPGVKPTRSATCTAIRSRVQYLGVDTEVVAPAAPALVWRDRQLVKLWAVRLPWGRVVQSKHRALRIVHVEWRRATRQATSDEQVRQRRWDARGFDRRQHHLSSRDDQVVSGRRCRCSNGNTAAAADVTPGTVRTSSCMVSH